MFKHGPVADAEMEARATQFTAVGHGLVDPKR